MSYTFDAQPQRSLYACELGPGGFSDEDFQLHIDNLRAACAELPEGEHLRVLVSLRKGHPLPNPAWRSRVAALMNEPTFRAQLAVISTRSVVRGILTAVSWLVSRDEVQFKMFPTATEAINWLSGDAEDLAESVSALVESVQRQTDALNPQAGVG